MIALLLALSAQAQDICADTCPYATVQAAVDAIPVGGSALYTIGGGYYEGNITVDEGRSLDLLSFSQEPAVLSAPPGTGAVISLLGGSSASLAGIYFDADGVRGIDASEGSTVSLSFSVLIGGGAIGGGGLIRMRDGSALDMFGSALFGALSNGDGGQILAEDSDIDLHTTTFFDGAGLSGGALMARAAGTRRSIVIDSCTVDGSAAVIRGGAFAFEGEVDVTLQSIAYRDCFSVDGGGVAVIGDGPDVLLDSNVAAEMNAVNSGGFLYQSGGTVFASQVAIGEGVATDGGGIAVVGGGFDGRELVVVESTITGRGGGIYASAGTVTVDNSLLISNDANEGGGAWLGPDVQVPMFARTMVCQNEALRGAGLAVHMTSDLELLNLRFLDNLAFENGGALLHDSDATLRIRAVNVLGNASASGGTAGILTSGSLELTDALVAYSAGGVGVRRTSDIPVVYDGGTSWWSNEQGDGDDLFPNTPGALFEDPQLLDYTQDDDCFNVQDFGSWYGPLRDTGSADLEDLDGTRADIGAYGGPDAYPDQWERDEDEDGVPMIYDCNESDPEAHPQAADPPYDGQDSNCDGSDDFDADGDGVRPPEHGGDDCDDTRADVFPGAEELPQDPPVDQNCDGRFDADGDGVEADEDCDDGDPDAYPGAVDGDPTRDLDCDGFVDGPQLTRPLTCDTGGEGAGWSLVLFLLLLPLRRRRAPGAALR